MLSYADKFKMAEEKYVKENKKSNTMRRKKRERLLKKIDDCYNQIPQIDHFLRAVRMSDKIIEEENLIKEILDDLLENVKNGKKEYARIFYLSKKYEWDKEVFQTVLESKLKNEVPNYDYDTKAYIDSQKSHTIEVRVSMKKRYRFKKKEYFGLYRYVSSKYENLEYVYIKHFDDELRRIIADKLYSNYLYISSVVDENTKDVLKYSGTFKDYEYFFRYKPFSNYDNIILDLFEKKLNENGRKKYIVKRADTMIDCFQEVIKIEVKN